MGTVYYNYLIKFLRRRLLDFLTPDSHSGKHLSEVITQVIDMFNTDRYPD